MTDMERDIELEESAEETGESGGTLSGRIEAILFVAGEPVRVEDLAKALNVTVRAVENEMSSFAMSTISISGASPSSASAIRCSWPPARSTRRMWCICSSRCRSSP